MGSQKSLPLRLDEFVYQRLKLQAASDGVSLNTLIQKVLDKALPPAHPFGMPRNLEEVDLIRPWTFRDPAGHMPNLVNETIGALLEDSNRLSYWLAFNQELIQRLVSFQNEIFEPCAEYLDATSKSRDLDNVGSQDKDAEHKKSLALEKQKVRKNGSLKLLMKSTEELKKIAANAEKIRRRRDNELLRSLALVISRLEWLEQDVDLIEQKIEK